MIPKCQFSANIVLQEEEEVPHLQHLVNITGAKPPFNFVTFDISPPGKTSIWFSVEFDVVLHLIDSK